MYPIYQDFPLESSKLFKQNYACLAISPVSQEIKTPKIKTLPSLNSPVNYDSPVLFYQRIKTPPALIHWWIKTSIRSIRKTRLNDIVLVMQGFYFFVKFGLVLIYILKVYRKKSSSILLRKNMFNSLLAFCFWKACTFSSFERFLCWKSRNYS